MRNPLHQQSADDFSSWSLASIGDWTVRIAVIAPIAVFLIARIAIGSLVVSLGAATLTFVLVGAVAFLKKSGDDDLDKFMGRPLGYPTVETDEPGRRPYGTIRPNKVAPGAVAHGAGRAGREKDGKGHHQGPLSSTARSAHELVDCLRSAGLPTFLSNRAAVGSVAAAASARAVEVIVRDERGTSALRTSAVVEAAVAPEALLAELNASGFKGNGHNWQVLSSNKDMSGRWTAVVKTGQSTFTLRLVSPEVFRAAVRGASEDSIQLNRNDRGTELGIYRNLK